MFNGDVQSWELSFRTYGSDESLGTEGENDGSEPLSDIANHIRWSGLPVIPYGLEQGAVQGQEYQVHQSSLRSGKLAEDVLVRRT